MKKLCLVLLIGLLLAIGYTASVSFTPVGTGMPESLWARTPWVGFEFQEVRAGSADGPAFNAKITGSWKGGRTFRREPTMSESCLHSLARWGALPRYRCYFAGYNETGRTVQRGDEVWQEFVLFDDKHGYVEYQYPGWWPDED